jgi:hemolysin III
VTTTMTTDPEPGPTPDPLDRAGDATAPAKPWLRGRLHEAGFWVSLAAGPALVIAAPGSARAAVAVFAVTLALLLGTSALYHRVTWQPRARAWMRRLDHSMIFCYIAGTYTAAAAALSASAGTSWVLPVVWGGAVAGIGLNLVWPDAPKPVSAAVYLALGWVAVAVLPDLYAAMTGVEFALLVAGGVAYSVGAVAYALRRPNPLPGVAGYHEVFHALVLVGAASHYAMIALALPAT